jgi:hypothetical protein
LRLSIIVVNWNVRELLAECLDSIDPSLGLPASEREIFVVDNASTDGSVEMLAAEYPEVTLLANSENLGFGRANNQAYARCRGDYVLLLNPDAAALGDALARMLAWMEAHPRAGALGSRLVNFDGSLQRWTGGALPTLWNVACHFLLLGKLLPPRWRPAPLFLDRDLGAELPVDWVSGACVLLRRQALGATIFDESYFLYGEDMDLCRRLGESGWEVVYGPFATVRHRLGGSMARQSGAILLSSLKGPHAVFAQRHGALAARLYDVMVWAGFAMRWVAYSVAALFAPGHSFGDKARSSRRYAGLALQVMLGR